MISPFLIFLVLLGVYLFVATPVMFLCALSLAFTTLFFPDSRSHGRSTAIWMLVLTLGQAAAIYFLVGVFGLDRQPDPEWKVLITFVVCATPALFFLAAVLPAPRKAALDDEPEAGANVPG